MLKSYKVWVIVSICIILLVAGGFLFGYFYVKKEAPHLFTFEKNIEERSISIDLDQLEYQLIEGITGAESLHVGDRYPEDKIYVGSINGEIAEISGRQWDSLAITKIKKLGKLVLGIAQRSDGGLFVSISDNDSTEWVEKGGYIAQLNDSLEEVRRTSGIFPSNNGLAISNSDEVFLATSNFNPYKPSGSILRFDTSLQRMDTVIKEIGVANGVYYSQQDSNLYLSNTFEGVYAYNTNKKQAERIYLKTRFKEITDELCVDPFGNIWMTDPATSTIKMYKTEARSLTRYDIKGIGQISSCRIRMENGIPILYMAELKRSSSEKYKRFDGRGLWVMPLIQLLER